VIGPEQRVDEEPRHREVGGVDQGQVLDQGGAEVGVGTVRLIGELAQLRVALALGHRDRIRRRPGRALGLLVLRDRRGFGLEVGVGALDRAL
jgi:hypothetical protein